MVALKIQKEKVMGLAGNPGSIEGNGNGRMMMRKPRVAEKLGISVATLDRLRGLDRTFPMAVQLGPQAIAWFVDEIDDWLTNRPRV